MKLFYFWPCAIFILLFFFSNEGVCQSPYYQGKTITLCKDAIPAAWDNLRNKVSVSIHAKIHSRASNHHLRIHAWRRRGGAYNHVYHSVKSDGLTIGASSPGILASAWCWACWR